MQPDGNGACAVSDEGDLIGAEISHRMMVVSHDAYLVFVSAPVLNLSPYPRQRLNLIPESDVPVKLDGRSYRNVHGCGWVSDWRWRDSEAESAESVAVDERLSAFALARTRNATHLIETKMNG